MYSSLACAWTGGFVVFGGLAAVLWIFIRSLSLHLQICWQITPGKKLLYSSQAIGWGIPILLGAVSLGVSGVSFRFGQVCHINHDNSLATFWGPILGFSALAAVLQFATLGYCIKVYLKHLWDPNTTSGASASMPSALPSMTGASSVRTKSARATYRRVRKVIALQWRGVVVVMILLVSAVYFSVIFELFDNLQQLDIEDPSRTRDWVLCLVEHGGNKNDCLDVAYELAISEPAVLAVLFLLAMMGIWCLLFLGRLAMFSGWWQLIRRPFTSNDNFVSYDARGISDPRGFEILTTASQAYYMTKGPTGSLVATAKPDSVEEYNMMQGMMPLSPVNKEFAGDSPTENQDSPIRDFTNEPSTFNRFNSTARSYSFSKPLPPAKSYQRDSRVTFSREGPVEIPPSATSHGDWPTAITINPPVQAARPRSPPFETPINPYESQEPPRSDSNMSFSSTTMLRSGSQLSNHGYGGSALGRAWPAPEPTHTRSTMSPTPVRSNSRQGALAMRQDWDPTTGTVYARAWAE